MPMLAELTYPVILRGPSQLLVCNEVGAFGKLGKVHLLSPQCAKIVHILIWHKCMLSGGLRAGKLCLFDADVASRSFHSSKCAAPEAALQPLWLLR